MKVIYLLKIGDNTLWCGTLDEVSKEIKEYMKYCEKSGTWKANIEIEIL